MKNITIIAPVLTLSGYGQRSRDVIKALLDLKDEYSISIIPVKWGDTPWIDSKDSRVSFFTPYIVQNMTVKPDIFIQITIPNEFQPYGIYNIGITAGIETNMCNPSWIEGCNRMNLVLGSSKHSIEVLQKSVFDKIDKNTKQVLETLQLKPSVGTDVLFEGVDTDVFKPVKTTSTTVKDLFKDIPETFCFLFVGHWLSGKPGQDRKDVGGLIQSFCTAFRELPENRRPALILKSSGAGFSIMDREEILAKIRALTKRFRNAPNIYLLHGELTDEEMNELYCYGSVKVLVSFTKGEGFGRPLLEFTTTGKPVICSNWSGPVDFLLPQYSFLLPGELTQIDDSAINEFLVKNSSWFSVNYPHAIEILRAVFKDYQKAKERGTKQREHTLSNFTLKHMTEKLISIIKNLESRASQPALIKFKVPQVKNVNI